jgi:ubiquinone/menaquinone biosynthesis C-methylase UbiE
MAAYDEIADWYETEFLASRANVPLGVERALRQLLGDGDGPCLELGCGTGVHAGQVRALGWTPLGVDLSARMLHHAKPRLPIVRADAARLCVRDASLPAVVAVLVHTDMADYPAVVREASRVLAPGGVFVHIGVHPCFCGAFADHTDRAAVVIRPGYHDRGWTTKSWHDKGIRDKVGATHLPVSELLNAVLDAGLRMERLVEGGSPTPLMLAVRARKPPGPAG